MRCDNADSAHANFECLAYSCETYASNDKLQSDCSGQLINCCSPGWLNLCMAFVQTYVVGTTESHPCEYLKTLHADAMTLSHGSHLIMKHGSLVASLQKVVAV